MFYICVVSAVSLITLLALTSLFTVKLKYKLIKQEQELESLKSSNTDLRCQNSSLAASLCEHKKHLEYHMSQLEELRKSHIDTEKLKAVLETEKSQLRSENSKNREYIETVQRSMSASFQELSSKIFREYSTTFSEISGNKVNLLITPIREDLKNFQNLINSSFSKQAEDKYKLEGTIKQLITHTAEIGNKAENLSSSLRNSINVQGIWGEFVLEKVLENSGLRKGSEYVVQQHKKIESIDGDSHQQCTVVPDVIINLPNSKQLIIDAKLPMKSYTDFVNADKNIPDADKNELKNFIQAMRMHIKCLSARRYQNVENTNTIDFVFLFIPIESAYCTIINKDKDIHRFAAENKIFLVSPATLMAILQTVATVWRTERQNLNSEQISKLGGYIHDKVAAFLQDMQKLKEAMNKADAHYESALKKLTSGKGSVVKKSHELMLLGAKVSKDIPSAFLDYDDSIHDDKESGNF